MDKKKQIFIVGCGDLGGYLAQLLHADYDVIGLRRSAGAAIYCRHTITADVTDTDSMQQLKAYAPDIVVVCVSASEQTDKNYREIYVEGLKNTLNNISQQHLKHVFFVSSTRVYGQNNGEIITEDSPTQPADFGGQRLLEAEQVLTTLPCPHTALRLSGIYGPGRTRMIRLAQTPALWPQQDTWTNRIHRDDAARFIQFLIEKRMQGEAIEPMYIVTDGNPTPQREVLTWIAQQLNIQLTADTKSAPNTGKKLLNHGMKSTAYVLQFDNYKSGYKALITSH